MGGFVKRPLEQDYTSLTAYTRALEEYCDTAQPTGQAPCVRHCEANAFKIMIRNLKGDIERLKQRTWVGLTDEEREEIALEIPIDAVSITEARLRSKNEFRRQTAY